MNNQELYEKLNEIALWCRFSDEKSKSDTKYHYWYEALCEAMEKINAIRLEEDDLPIEDNEMLISRFVAELQYDISQHKDDEGNWERSDACKALWDEIKNRLNAPTCLEFDRDAVLKKLRDDALTQRSLAKRCDSTTSYHKGIESGLYSAIEEIEKHTKKRKKI